MVPQIEEVAAERLAELTVVDDPLLELDVRFDHLPDRALELLVEGERGREGAERVDGTDP
ncbi:MAG: hypothetical protein ABW298_07280 [Candidatus Binatia bacterium]